MLFIDAVVLVTSSMFDLFRVYRTVCISVVTSHYIEEDCRVYLFIIICFFFYSSAYHMKVVRITSMYRFITYLRFQYCILYVHYQYGTYAVHLLDHRPSTGPLILSFFPSIDSLIIIIQQQCTCTSSSSSVLVHHHPSHPSHHRTDFITSHITMTH